MMIPTFGHKNAHKDYVTRYGVYAIIPNHEQTKIILVQAPNGSWFYLVVKLKQVKVSFRP